MGAKTGGARREKCKEASGGGGGEKASGTAASVVGDRRGLRTTAQEPPRDARRRLEGRAAHKTGDARGRGSWRSSLLGHPGAKFLCEKLGKAGKKKKRSKEEGKKREGIPNSRARPPRSGDCD